MAPLETQKAIRAARLSMEQLNVPPLHAETMHIAAPIQEGPATRIVIAKLVLVNFKSYAGTQKIGPFHKSFSAVVGPNGSGKSNVIDSLLFVFGFRAAKMRQGKISALIHHSAAHPNLEFCSVEVHFETIYDDVQDPEDYRVVPDSKIVVARKAYKSNASKYTINGKDSSFTEVTTLLKNSGIDLDHKRFLILQGEVESIAQMRPKAATEHDDGLLEYLEDIIGTSRYKSPIEGALQRTEALNEVVTEQHARVARVTQEKERLEGKKDIAVSQIQQENALAVKQSMLYQLQAAQCTEQMAMTQQMQGEAKQALEALSHAAGLETADTLKKSFASKSKHHETLKKQLAVLVKEQNATQESQVKVQERIKHLSAKQKKLAKQATVAEQALRESTRTIEQAEEEAAKLTAQVNTLDTSLVFESAELAKIRAALSDKTQVYADQIEAKQREKQPWDVQMQTKKSALALCQSERQMLLDKAAAVEREAEEAQTLLEEVTQQLAACDTKALQKEIACIEKELATGQKQVAALQQQEAQAKNQLASARQKSDEARSNLAASTSQSNVLAGLTKLSESGRIEGFHGRLGDLGKIASKYDVAISTACPQLENIVVQSVDAGQACIDHLRRNNLGRAMFILLDRLPSRDLQAIQTPENVPRLFDLVQPRDARFAPAFYSVLQNTLVAESLEQANRLAYGGKQRWRVVTLDGQSIDKSGTMTGGGQRVAKGGMASQFVASSESAAGVAKLEKEQQACLVSFEQVAADLAQAELRVAGYLQALPKLQLERQKRAIEEASLLTRQGDLQTRCRQLAAGASAGMSPADAKREKALVAQVKALEADMEQLAQETSSLEHDIKQLQDKILEVGGIKLRTQSSKVESLKDQLQAMSERLHTLDLSKAKALAQSKTFSSQSEKAAAELASVETDLSELQAQLDGEGDAGLAKQIEDLQYTMEASNDELAALKQELDLETEQRNKIAAQQQELEVKLQEHTKRLQEASAKLAWATEKRSSLALIPLSHHFATEAQGSLDDLTADELQALDKAVLTAEIQQLKQATQDMQIEQGVLEEYISRCEEHASRSQMLAESISERDAARSMVEDLRTRRLTEFMEGFSIISARLKEMYQMITMGGNAELELVDSLDPFSEGILFSVMPPKKSWKNIANLSGGEKTLSSLALVFALHHYKPTPLYVMDEIDAALDFRNVSIVANYIRDRTKNAQFIVISLRNNMFELSARLIGIYKTSNMTRSISLENKEIERASSDRATVATSV
ncbi:RecF/RecN/SMC protein [Protomyces lactucae-debilis]|uniref:Structural maintenance of chromosomes protein n=1 Tax=Protomyces lactucae-debilis TaxID=2754530 RepID=A0A1Y2FKC6_PROLT|nr:RecF/RecN/SMC protein [Protomyces lactucae-debilis]ORY84389.1 RecF/RecN/SMC protein [Protomyces lactucae-debilis]